ncbi:phage tail length tape measure family protein [Manganibacter manganicus]|uniref:Bacteriophage tail tape measure N-terminal domain-containing protein n=1 Tax=Manganibacter manganicus TaxID=1873176 RepID=A0A1V8RRI7_9HYPH|nr:phage tail length tape measure family protein [Pseudaminobacter manganicus]OQM75599.1 hypothetical protein BFN67_17660 [Pseudaminobacter manganicus]
MANRERVVEFAVKARDEYSKVLKNLEQQQKKLSAAAKASNRLEITGAAKAGLADATAEYDRLISSIKRYSTVMATARKTGNLSAAEMREVADALKLTGVRAGEAAQKMAAAKAASESVLKTQIRASLNNPTKSGYAAFIRNAEGAKVESAAVATTATQLNKLAVASKNASTQQNTLKSRMDAATNSMRRQRVSGGSGNKNKGLKGNAQDVEIYGLKPWQLTNLGYQVNDVVSGLAMGQRPLQILSQQAGQFVQIWPNVMVSLAKSIPVIAGVTAVLTPFVVAAMRMHDTAESVRIFSSQLALSADGADYSAEKLAKYADQVTDLGVKMKDARTIIGEFAKAGIDSSNFNSLAKMAKQLSDISGDSVADSAKKLSTAFTGTVKDVRDLDKELNFLTASQLDSIYAMDEAGDRTGALALAQDILRGKLASTVKESGEWGQAVDSLGDAWDKFIKSVQQSGVIELAAKGLDILAKAAQAAADGVNGLQMPHFKNAVTDAQRLANLNQQILQLRSTQSGGITDLAGNSFGGAGDELKSLEAERDVLLKKVSARQEELQAIKDGSAEQKKSDEQSESKQKAINDILHDQIETLDKKAETAGLTNRALFVEQAAQEALNRAKKEGLDLTKKTLEAIKDQAGATYDQIQAAKYVNGEGTSALAKKIVGAEYGNGSKYKNDNSSASGAGQFIASTWLAMFKKYFPDRAAGLVQTMGKAAGEKYILDLRKDAKLSEAMVERYIQENSRVLQKAGVAVNDASLYLAHFLGPQGAVNLLRASPTDAVSGILGQDQINANKSILQNKTAGQVVEWAKQKMNLTNAELETTGRLVELDAERAKKSEKYLADYQQRVETQRQELDLMSKSAREQAIAKAIRAEELKAKAAGLELTKEQRAETAALAAKEFDRKNVNLEVNQLLEQRRALFESLQIAQQAGDQTKVVAVVGQISDVETKLNAAIEKAIQFWQAIGGPGADQAIMQLQNLQAGIGAATAKIENQFLPKAEEINEKLADVGGNAFSAFAQALANGENAAKAFFNALLQGLADFMIEIGKAIIKQALFNALSGGGGAGGSGGIGGLIGGAISSIFHSGGIVGRTNAPTRMVNPAIFANAQRFHTGGIAGLGPRERPIIAMDDEEIIRRDDPRHVLNGGGRGTAVNLKNVNVFDPADVVEAALQSLAGEKVMINFLTRNSRKVSAAIQG